MSDALAEGCGGVGWSDRTKVNWWLVLIGPGAAGAMLIYNLFEPAAFQSVFRTMEVVAPFIAGLAALLYAVRWLYTRNDLYLILACLGLAFMLRENRDAWVWTKKGVYVMLVIIGIWMVLWRKRIARPIQDWRHTSWLIATLACYFFSQVIARRAFRGIPGEQAVCRSLEESLENVAHIMLVITASLGSLSRKGTPPTAPETPETA